jgi:hypothetical protein
VLNPGKVFATAPAAAAIDYGQQTDLSDGDEPTD